MLPLRPPPPARRLWLVVLVTAASACGASAPRPATPDDAEVVEMEEMRIVATRGDDGEIAFESYDAEGLFLRGVELMNAQRCHEAVRAYDRVADEFPGSRWVSPSLYNAGLCLKEGGDLEGAIARFDRLLEARPESTDVRDASFLLAELLVADARWDRALAMADGLLRREDLEVGERIEGMARRAQALVGGERPDEAAAQAEAAVMYYRSFPEEERPRDVFFVSAAAFVWAETLRIRSEAIALPDTGVEAQHAALESRARLILDAQQAYNRAISFGNPHWAAASGYRIGQMYDAFWATITTAPVPEPAESLGPEEEAAYRAEYRTTLALVVKPLIRNAIRFWESTLLMVERTGVQNEWAAKAREDLEQARARLLEQPEGPEGFSALREVEERGRSDGADGPD